MNVVVWMDESGKVKVYDVSTPEKVQVLYSEVVGALTKDFFEVANRDIFEQDCTTIISKGYTIPDIIQLVNNFNYSANFAVFDICPVRGNG